MTSYLNILYNTFGITLWVTLPLLIISFSAILFMFIISLLLFLDAVYRPNTPQYSFNFILDRLLPAIAIFSPPSLILFFFKPFETGFARLFLVILIHIFILLPIFHYWSKLRRWDDMDNKQSYESWNHPRLYKHIVIATIYPLLWGLYLSCSRFLRLGSTYNVIDYFSSIHSDFIVMFFLFPHVILWVLIPLVYISQIRKYLWNELYVLLYSFHILFLQFYSYFRVMELLYKSAFFVTCILTLNINNHNYKPWWQKFINHLYYNPKWFTIMMFSSLIVEIILTNKLYYGIYTLFLFPFIYSLLSSYFAYYSTNFIFDCCFSDYCNQKDNFKKVHYPIIFWKYFNDAEYYFGFVYEYTPIQAKEIAKQMNKRESQWVLRKKVSQDIHQDLLNMRIHKQKNAKFCLRMTANYQHMNRVRWMHTERILNTTYKFHSCTALFSKSTYDNIVLLNNSWGNLNHIQAARVYTEIPLNMYKPSKQTFKPLQKTFIGLQEANIPSNFGPISEKGVIVEPYDKNNRGHMPVFKPQENPDTIFNFKYSTFKEKRIHSSDQKTNNPGLGNNKILSEISQPRYNSTIDRFEKHLQLIHVLTDDIREALFKLKTTYNNFTEHQLVWAENLHLFPDNFIPPLKIPQNFSYAQLSSEALREIRKSEYHLKKISDYLYTKKVPQINHGNFPKEALDLFQDSEMLKILKQDFEPFVKFNDLAHTLD